MRKKRNKKETSSSTRKHALKMTALHVWNLSIVCVTTPRNANSTCIRAKRRNKPIPREETSIITHRDSKTNCTQRIARSQCFVCLCMR